MQRVVKDRAKLQTSLSLLKALSGLLRGTSEECLKPSCSISTLEMPALGTVPGGVVSDPGKLAVVSTENLPAGA